jgi:hypothetical protein
MKDYRFLILPGLGGLRLHYTQPGKRYHWILLIEEEVKFVAVLRKE